jgi:transposase-like protein
VDLVEAGRKASEVATELEVSEQTIHTWRYQARIATGLAALAWRVRRKPGR